MKRKSYYLTMRSFAVLFFFLIAFHVSVAQVPQKMAYQIMALDPATGRVLANRNVDVRIELRRGAQDGPSVWSQQFSVTTDEAGICNLTLTLADTISWGAASYYHSCGHY